MKEIKVNLASYEYDVHSLVKSFYAEDGIKVYSPETKAQAPEVCDIVINIQEDCGADITIDNMSSLCMIGSF